MKAGHPLSVIFGNSDYIQSLVHPLQAALNEIIEAPDRVWPPFPLAGGEVVGPHGGPIQIFSLEFVKGDQGVRLSKHEISATITICNSWIGYRLYMEWFLGLLERRFGNVDHSEFLCIGDGWEAKLRAKEVPHLTVQYGGSRRRRG